MMFKTRRSFVSRRSMWLRWFGCFVCVMTFLQTYYYLATHPDSAFRRNWIPTHRYAILRPGQYRETAGLQFVEAVSDEEGDGPDEMGLVHDTRFVNALARL